MGYQTWLKHVQMLWIHPPSSLSVFNNPEATKTIAYVENWAIFSCFAQGSSFFSTFNGTETSVSGHVSTLSPTRPEDGSQNPGRTPHRFYSPDFEHFNLLWNA